MLRKVIFTQRVDAHLAEVFKFYEEQGVPVHGSLLYASVLRASQETLRYQPGVGKALRKGPPPVRAYLIMRSHWLIYQYSDTHLILTGFYSAKGLAFAKLAE